MIRSSIFKNYRGGIPKAKPVFDAKPRWEVDRKLNKLTTREQVEKMFRKREEGVRVVSLKPMRNENGKIKQG